MSLRSERRKQKRVESKAFKKLVDERTRAARRRAYEKEALVVAEEKGRELARRPSFGKRVIKRAKVTLAPRKPTRRAPISRRAPIRRRTPIRRRVYKRKPVRRTMRRAATTRREQAPTRSIMEDLI